MFSNSDARQAMSGLCQQRHTSLRFWLPLLKKDLKGVTNPRGCLVVPEMSSGKREHSNYIYYRSTEHAVDCPSPNKWKRFIEKH